MNRRVPGAGQALAFAVVLVEQNARVAPARSATGK